MPAETLIDALDRAPADAPFITFWSDDAAAPPVTFGEFAARSRRWAGALAALGARPGDRVVLIVRQSVDLMVAFAAAMRLGAVPAILAYPHRKLEPNKYRAGLSGVSKNLTPRLFVIDDELPQELRASLDVAGASIVTIGQLRAAPESTTTFAPLATDLAFIQHSAGTTGLQKGVALSHEAVLHQVRALSATLGLTPADRVCSWLPLYHDMGLVACFMLPMACTIPVVMQDPLEWVIQPASMLRAMTAERCTLAWLPNFAFQFMARRVNEEERQGLDLSHVRAFVSCSEPVRAGSIDEFCTAFGPYGLRRSMVQTSYAMAETVFAVTQSPVGTDLEPRRIWADGAKLRDERRVVEAVPDSPGALCLVSSGPLLNEVSARVVAPGGEEAAPEGLGEIHVRAPWLFNGYYNRPDLTDKAMRDGWYASGDLGLVRDGELFVLARTKDLIIVGGRNIYPEDVEAIVTAHPRVHDGRAVALGFYNAEAGTEDIVVVAEAHSPEHLADRVEIERALRQAVTVELGVPVRVCLKEPGWIVKSSAGKPARADTRAKLLASNPEFAPGDGDPVHG
jgi:fatty-acyl-CoA synthase